MPVDILIPVRNQYLLIRQLFESICLKIPNKEIGKIIIVDDHSSDRRQINYLKYLFEKGKIHFVRNGIPLPSHYSKIPLSFLKSKGHGGSLNIGLEYVTAEYVFIIDPDCIILRKDILKNSLPCFDQDPKIMSVGQVVGGVRGIKVIGQKERENPETKTEYVRKKPHHYGMTNASCMLVRMEAWKNHGISKFWNGGWAHMPFGKSIFGKEFKTCNFNFYTDEYLIHLGRATMKNMKFKYLRFRTFKDGTPPYGMSYEQPHYGRKELGENYIGYLELKVPSEEYDRLLEEKYGDLPFDQMAQPVDPRLFGPPLKQN